MSDEWIDEVTKEWTQEKRDIVGIGISMFMIVLILVNTLFAG